MSRDGAIIFADLIGKLDVLCPLPQMQSRRAAILIEECGH
jgi:hypothetical protein